jgi:hypothetical protein
MSLRVNIKQNIPALASTSVAISTGVLVLVGLFLETRLNALLLLWASIVVAFALLLGVVNLLRVHLTKIQHKEADWRYSLLLLGAFSLTIIFGWAGPDSAGGQALFTYILRPLEATFFALLAFFMASAAYRIFRIKDFESFLLVAFAIIVLLGQVPAGFHLWPDFPLVKEWVLRVPALAGIRGILLGVSLGTIATGIRVLLAADRPYTDSERR